MSTLAPENATAGAANAGAARPDPSAQQILTPRVGKVLRRALFWALAGVFALVVAVIALGNAGSTALGEPLASDNASPAGGMALAEVLRQQGVTVVAASTLDEAADAIDSPADTTLLIYDTGLYLGDDRLREAVALADTVVFVDPSFTALDEIAPAVAQAGFVDGVLEADCDVRAVDRAETVSGGGSGFRVIDESVDATACLGSGDDVYSLVQLERGDTTLTLLGTTDALSNGFIANDGNAAFALTLLGAHGTLVWYLPSFGDVPGDGTATIGDLSPTWVLPVVWLLAITALIAAFWQGRRFGPLVIENLPVTVRSSETMLGRARLYEKSNSRLRALDSLRIGTVQRLSILCGLPRVATVDEVVAAVSARTGAQIADVRALLVEREPTSDRELVALSDALLTLEADVARRVRT